VQEDDEAIGVRVRQRPQQHVIDDTERRGRRADAEREREDDREARSSRSPQQAKAVPGVAEEVREPSRRRRVAGGFLDRLEAAGLDERGAPRLLRRPALRDLLVGELVDIGADLGVQFALGAAAAERARPPEPQPLEGHD
jgi:hypothetical protein